MITADKHVDTAAVGLTDVLANSSYQYVIFTAGVDGHGVVLRVALIDDTQARVLRANPDAHTKPVVEEIGEDGETTGKVIDLSTVPDLVVIKAS